MKILMLTTQLGYGGAETSFIRLANCLAQSMDVTIALFTNTGTYSAGHAPLDAKVHVTLLDTASSNQFVRWWRRIRTFRSLKQQHDVAISFLSGPNMVNVLAGKNARSIISIRGSRKYDPVSSCAQRWLFHYVIDPIIYLLAGAIVPVSDGLRQEIPSYAQSRIHVISPFIEPLAIAERLNEPLPQAYAALRNQKVIVAVGRLSVEKGFHHLIRVFSALSKREAGIKLLLVGDGPMLQSLRTQCSDLALATDDMSPAQNAVIFAGYQKNVLPFIALGRVLALTSATEGFPNVLLEAMAAGVPIIAADTPWGARAILHKHDTSKGPYPTHRITHTDYGTLMPRIDDINHQHMWVDALAQALEQPHAPNCSARVTDFSLETVGASWKLLVEN
ncbi:MAG: glycosyltransferase [Alphaproteobacteria bacterium]|nr:glycosyltransferase [Alphaproteobacteria bacterium]